MIGRIKTRMRRVNSGTSRSDSDSSKGAGDPLVSPAPSSSPTVRAPPSTAFLERAMDYNAKVEELAAFDACVEACDALAASSSYAQSSVKRDKETGLIDCSVLVSPDGDLLLLPQDAQDSSPTKETTTRETPEEATQTDVKEDDMLPSTSSKVQPSLLDSEFSGHDDYESAVVMGNDLRPDKSINKFSAMGWSPSATTIAIRQTEQSMRQTGIFFETLILSQKEAAARTSDACDQLRSTSGILAPTGTVPPMPTPAGVRVDGPNKSLANSHDDYDIITALDAIPQEIGGIDVGPNRVGPISSSSGSLHTAMVALEHYYSVVAENDSSRLRNASKSVNSNVGVLAALYTAAEQTTQRAYNREKALQEMQQRVDAMESRLNKCKIESKRRWDAVHDAEESVSRIVEERMMERSRQREQKRREQLREEEEKRGNSDLGATPGEIWDIVSAVAESMEDGSFAPTGLPDAPVAGPQDKSSDDRPTGTANSVKPLPATSSIPLASRVEIEQECGLPGLRAAAMASNEKIEDTAQSLLNILSTLDTTRRSARVAAETCLLSACHAHATSLRSLVALEKTAIEDRLERIKEVERTLDDIDVRSDLDAYISADKKERGGSTRLGEDDDGGVASALAVLSSHVDGSMGIVSPIRISTEGWDDDEENKEEITPEQLEDAVEALFESNDILIDGAKDSEEAKKAHAEFESTVQFLCKIALDKSPSSRSRRSTICYALNSKRSSNAEIETPTQFDGLCKLFDSILMGGDNESSGVSNAKMCMMLSQTFYMKSGDEDEGSTTNPVASPSRASRNNRVFVKNRLTDHPLWSDEEFWDQALYQCVTESLTHSGVMSNFDRGSSTSNKSEWTETKKIKWHDLTQTERFEAASQVHAVVFAQLGALAHSMVEFGCGLERSCAFVRRMAIRNQLPVSQRTMLLKHLMKRDGAH